MRALAFLVLAPLAGCLLVTGSTDGYELAVDAGSGGSDAGGAGSLTLGCVSSVDCDRDAGAPICCLVVSTTTSAASSCQAGPCGGLLPIQLCKEDAECGGSPCTSQACPYSGATITVRACGTVIGCTAK